MSKLYINISITQISYVKYNKYKYNMVIKNLRGFLFHC